MRQEAVQEVLEGLPGREDAEVRERRGGEVAAHDVASVRPHGRRIRALRRLEKLVVALHVREVERFACLRMAHGHGVDREHAFDVGDHRVDLRRVCGEKAVHERDVRVPMSRGHERRLAEPEEVAVCVALVEADVASGLLEERDADPRVLQHLCRHVRDALDREVRTAELRDGVVAVPHEHAVVKGARPRQRLAVVRGF
jgi:hypothetical protein